MAKDLLRHDGVFICAINKREVHRLGLLLEETFPKHEVHCITIVHNPRGIRGKNLSYTHEFIYFVFRKNLKVMGNRKIDQKDITWLNLRNGGGESLRTTSKNCFYPIIIKDGKIIGFGDVVPNNVHPEGKILEKNNCLYMYPIDPRGIERKWRYARQSVEKVQEFFRVRKTKNSYEIEMGKNYGTVRTVWFGSKYDCSHHGTMALHKLLPGVHFDFPKSIHAVYDCLDPVLRNRKDALVLDFFAGSGTTGHAVLKLNAEDGGRRKFFLCTNNEGNICTDICYPRIKKIINGYNNQKNVKVNGLGGNLRYFKIKHEQQNEKT